MLNNETLSVERYWSEFSPLVFFRRFSNEVVSFLRKLILLKRRFVQLVIIAVVLVMTPDLKAEKKFRLFFERAGGAFIKLGQILSMRYDLLPESYVSELLGLLSNVEAVSTAEMEEVFFKDFGVYPKEYFAHFDRKAVASASISQVYRATLHSGQEVVVKIRRPGVVDIFETDFVLARFIQMLIWPFSIFHTADVDEAVSDFIDWTRKELDFSNEVKNACSFYENCEGLDDVIIPVAYASHSTSSVMVSEYIQTIFSVEDIILNLESDVNFEKILKNYYGMDAEALAYRFVKDGMRQFFIDGFFHADPHPANIFFLPKNKLGYFDFGIVGRAGPERLDLLHILEGIAEKDFDQVAKNMMSFTKQALDKEVSLLKKYSPDKYDIYEPAILKIEEILIDEIADDFSKILAPLYEAPLSGQKINSSLILADIFMKTNQYSIYLPHNVAIFFRSLIIADMVALRLCPRFDIVKALKEFFAENSLVDIEKKVEAEKEALEKGDIDPVGVLSYEDLLEMRDDEKDRLDATVEYLIDIASFYAENYEEVRLLLKGKK